MERIKNYVARWADGRTPMEFAALIAGATVIAIVPGALVLWLAWRFLRTRKPFGPRHRRSPAGPWTPKAGHELQGVTHVL